MAITTSFLGIDYPCVHIIWTFVSNFIFRPYLTWTLERHNYNPSHTWHNNSSVSLRDEVKHDLLRERRHHAALEDVVEHAVDDARTVLGRQLQHSLLVEVRAAVTPVVDEHTHWHHTNITVSNITCTSNQMCKQLVGFITLFSTLVSPNLNCQTTTSQNALLQAWQSKHVSFSFRIL